MKGASLNATGTNITVRFTINRIHSKQRPRHLKNGHTYTPRETKEYEEEVAWNYKAQTDGYVFQGPVSVTMLFTFIKPKSVKREYPTVKPDLDNTIKSVLDGLNGCAYRDDSQVCRIFAEKQYGSREKVYVLIQGD